MYPKAYSEVELTMEPTSFNQHRRRREEALRRRHYRERAQKLDGIRSQFDRWMHEHGFSDAERGAELAKLQEHVDLNVYMSEEGDVD